VVVISAPLELKFAVSLFAEREAGLRAGQRNILVVLQRLILESESEIVLALGPQDVVLQFRTSIAFH